MRFLSAELSDCVRKMRRTAPWWCNHTLSWRLGKNIPQLNDLCSVPSKGPQSEHPPFVLIKHDRTFMNRGCRISYSSGYPGKTKKRQLTSPHTAKASHVLLQIHQGSWSPSSPAGEYLSARKEVSAKYAPAIIESLYPWIHDHPWSSMIIHDHNMMVVVMMNMHMNMSFWSFASKLLFQAEAVMLKIPRWMLEAEYGCQRCSFKIDLFLRGFEPTSKPTFRARLPSIFITCHEMPRLPRNLHLVITSRSADNKIRKNTQHETSQVLRLLRKIESEVSKVLRVPRKTQHIFWKCCESTARAAQNDFWHVLKHVGMPRSATPATWNEATRRWKKPKVTLFVNFPRHGHTAPTRTFANGCGRLRTVANVNATSGEHSSTPTPPEWNGNPCYAFGKKWFATSHLVEWQFWILVGDLGARFI